MISHNKNKICVLNNNDDTIDSICTEICYGIVEKSFDQICQACVTCYTEKNIIDINIQFRRNNINALCWMGWYNYCKSNNDHAKEIYEQGILKKSSKAMNCMGWHYQFVEKNMTMAKKYYKMSVQNNNKYIDGIINLGNFYCDVMNDKSKSINTFKKLLDSTKKNEVSIQIATMYNEMEKTSKSYLCKYWYRRKKESYYKFGALNGHDDALIKYIEILEEKIFHYNKKYLDELEKYYIMASNKNITNSMPLKIAIFYDHCRHKLNLAKSYYLKAIELDNQYSAHAMRFLGNMYHRWQDYVNMVKYYELAIDRGDVGSMVRLLFYYAVQNDKKKMKKYLLMLLQHADLKKINESINELEYTYALFLFHNDIRSTIIEYIDNNIVSSCDVYMASIDKNEIELLYAQYNISDYLYDIYDFDCDNNPIQSIEHESECNLLVISI